MKNTLFCFAVPGEARPFLKESGARCPTPVLITGMGRSNARKALRRHLTADKPDRVISCGFAGALDPTLKVGDIVFDAAQSPGLDRVIVEAGGRPARFCCVDTVVCKASEKRLLRDSTGADAVDMESDALSEVCREANLEFAIVRVVSDCADEDLPVDFNRFITAGDTIDFPRLVLWTAIRPAVMMKLLSWRRQLRVAANRLARVLIAIELSGQS
jgi:nucleoside phosphorylase